MASLNGLPVYKITINEALDNKTGVDFISLVDYPAIETNWVAMSAKDKKLPGKIYFNKAQQLLCGPFLIPDMPIYRYDEKMGEYYVVFTKEEIVKIVRKFQTQRKTLNINYQHQDDSQVQSAVIQEIWLTGKSDKSKDFGFDLPEGSGFAITYIGDQKFWTEEVESGNVRGYSVEGWLDMELKNQIKKYMSKDKFMEAKTADGNTLKTPDDNFTVGGDATIVAADGTESPAEGDYTLDNGTVIKCVAGKVTEIVEAAAQSEELSPEELAALKKAFAPLFAIYDAAIAEIKTQMANTPGAPAATTSTDLAGTEKVSPAKAVMAKLAKIKELNKK